MSVPRDPIHITPEGAFAADTTLQFHDYTSGGTVTSWAWKIGETPFSTAQNPSLDSMAPFLEEIITIGDTDYFPVTLEVNGGESVKTRNIEIVYIVDTTVDFSWEQSEVLVTN